MFERLRAQVLRVMRVPPEPTPPLGAPGSIRVFRAGRNYYKLRLARWGLGQAAGLIGLGFSLTFFCLFTDAIKAAQIASQQPTPAAMTPLPTVMLGSPEKKAAAREKQRIAQVNFFKQLARHSAPWMIVVLDIFEVGGVLLFLAQLPVTFALVRLEYDLHWYIVTDRSLRIRTGVIRLQESTMSFANLQQVEVKQGPLQRLLGLADVHVQSAGGAGDSDDKHGDDSLHTGIFHSVDNAQEIRDLILERLRQFRQTGLGDPDDHHDQVIGDGTPSSRETSPSNADPLTAARELLAEARALRATLS